MWFLSISDMRTKEDYLALITSEHRLKPKFTETVGLTIAPLASLQTTLDGFINDFDLETAIGVQLNVIGEWVKANRYVDVPLEGVYFSWDSTPSVGWEAGVWQGPFDPDTGLTYLPDDAYRTLIKGKIAANKWDGTIPGAYEVWSIAFPNSPIVIQDNQDMSMTIGLSSSASAYQEKVDAFVSEYGSLWLDFISDSYLEIEGYDFADRGFAGLVTYTRAGNAGRFNSAGLFELVGPNVPRFDYDPVTLQPRGLLIEEARTNLLTRSGTFNDAAWGNVRSTVVAAAATGIDGTASATKVVPNAAAPGSWAGLSRTGGTLVPVTSGTTYSAYWIVKAGEYGYAQVGGSTPEFSATYATVDLATGLITSQTAGLIAAVTAEPNGFWRISVTQTAIATGNSVGFFCAVYPTAVATRLPTATYDGVSGIYAYGAQLEAGAFPTSHIPTVASTVTRAADVASVNTLSPWYNALEGTLLVEGDSTWVGGGASYVASLDNGTTSNTIAVRRVGSNLGGLVLNGAVSQANLQAAYSTGANFKSAMAYKADDFAFAMDGGTPLLDTVGTVPAVTTLNIGSLAGSLRHAGHIRSLRYWPRRLPNAELQELTA